MGGSDETQAASLDVWTATVDGPREPSPYQPVDRIGRFAILRVLGEGGMGRVLVGYDERLDRRVAIKLLRRTGQGDAGDARLMREAQALARLSHPNVVQVHEAGVHGDAVYVAMELVEGDTLAGWLRTSKDRAWRSALEVLIQAGRGLEAAHAAGIVHRDFKPQNVIVGADGRARVLDFGLARGVGAEPVTRETPTADVAEAGGSWSDGVEPGNLLRAQLTRRGAVMGTPAYMAPEQHEGATCDASADQFAFCVSAFEALFGALPFATGSLSGLVGAKLRGAVAPIPSDSRVPRRVREAIARGLRCDPAGRWPSMTALLAALEGARGGMRRWPVVAVGAVGLALIGVVALRSPEVPCQRVDAPALEVWSSARRAASARGLSPAEAGAVLPRLDGWAARWGDAARESCEDVHVRHRVSPGGLDRRGVCLGRQLADFEALARALAAGELEGGPALREWLGRLDDPELCLSEAVLLSELEAVPAAHAREIAALRQQMIRLELGREGRSLPARIVAAEEMLARSEAIGWRPLVGEAELLVGRLYTLANDGGAARRHLGAAIDVADAAQDVDQQSSAWSAMNQVERLVEFDVVRARWALDREAAALGQAEGSPRQRARLLSDRGRTEELAGDEAAAERSLRAASELLEREEPFAGWQQAEVLRDLSNLLAYTGRADEASALLERARRLELGSGAEARAGERVRETISARLDAGITMIQSGENEAAVAQLNEVLAAATAELGPRSELVARAHVGLAAAHSVLGDVEALRVHAELADRISLATLGPLHPLRVDVLSAVGESAIQERRVDAAVRAFEAALRLVRRIKPGDSIAVGQAEFNLADVLHQDGQDARAHELLTRALPTLERSLGEHPLVDEARRLDLEIRAAVDDG